MKERDQEKQREKCITAGGTYNSRSKRELRGKNNYYPETFEKILHH